MSPWAQNKLARAGVVPRLSAAASSRAYLMRTPMDLRKAWVSASVLLISKEKISLPAMAVNGVSGPRACAMPGEEMVWVGRGGPGTRFPIPTLWQTSFLCYRTGRVMQRKPGTEGLIRRPGLEIYHPKGKFYDPIILSSLSSNL